MDKIIALLFDKLWAKLQPEIEEQFKKLLPILVDKITALLPVVVAAATKAIGDQVMSKIPDIDLPGLPPLPDLAEQIRGNVNQIPDIDIPGLSEIFDLTDWLGGKRP